MGKFSGMFDPTREGPGVSKNQREKRRFFLFFEIYFRKLSKIILLNIIYVLMCIPIITIGPATAALTYCMRNFAREEHADLSDFFDQFKKNFWQSLVVWLVFTFGFFVIIFGIIFYNGMLDGGDSIIGFLGLLFSILSSVVFLFMSYYVYLILVTFKVNFRQLIKDTFLFAFIGLGRNLIATFFIAIIYGWFAINLIVPLVAPLFNPDIPVSLDAASLALALYIFFIPTLSSLIVNFTVYPGVKRFMIDPALSKLQKEVEEESVFEDAE
ncbi:MAG: YesL family protein [Oscillospiraceae bacterium]|nr:YesL family protein [Oscillospiraceae bacterium]